MGYKKRTLWKEQRENNGVSHLNFLFYHCPWRPPGCPYTVFKHCREQLKRTFFILNQKGAEKSDVFALKTKNSQNCPPMASCGFLWHILKT